MTQPASNVTFWQIGRKHLCCVAFEQVSAVFKSELIYSRFYLRKTGFQEERIRVYPIWGL